GREAKRVGTCHEQHSSAGAPKRGRVLSHQTCGSSHCAFVPQRTLTVGNQSGLASFTRSRDLFIKRCFMGESARIAFPPTEAVAELSSVRARTVPWYVWSSALAITSTTVGLYWDISWHITIGRDSFWTPAHLAIQFGAVLAALCCGALILGATFGKDASLRQASVKVWGFRGPFGAFLAAWGGATMLISAPFDNWWHDSFGLDVQIISPPHMVLATGIFFVGIGTLVLMAGPKNRAEGASRLKLERLFLYIGGVLLT